MRQKPLWLSILFLVLCATFFVQAIEHRTFMRVYWIVIGAVSGVISVLGFVSWGKHRRNR